MASFLKLPTPEDGYPDTQIGVSLNDQTFILHYLWSGLYGRWSLSILDKDSSPIVEGLIIMADWDLLQDVLITQLPEGASILSVDTSGQQSDPGQFDLGDRVILLYRAP